MFKLRPIVLVLSASLLQACVAPPAKQEMAMESVLRVRHSSDQTAATYYQLGKYHQERGNLELAVSAYTHSVALDSRQLEPRNALAAILAQQGRLGEAQSVLLQVVSDYPAVAHPYNNLGYVYYLQGDYNAAVSTLQRALALDVSNERARNNLALVQAAVASRGELALATQALELAKSKAAAISTEAPVHAPALAAVAPSPMPRTLEAVQIVPHVNKLEQKPAIAPAIAQLPVEKALVSVERTSAAAPEAAKKFRMEIANGNGVIGMAKRIGQVLGQYGIAVSRLTNERPYRQQDTQIQYRAGYEEQARTLQKAINGHAITVQASNLSSRSDVRLLLGKDAIAKLALIDELGKVSPLAMNEATN